MRRKKTVEPVVTEPVIERERGPRFRIEADAKYSTTYTGRIDLGLYSLVEKNKGKIDKRVQALIAEGYQNVSVREVLSDD